MMVNPSVEKLGYPERNALFRVPMTNNYSTSIITGGVVPYKIDCLASYYTGKAIYFTCLVMNTAFSYEYCDL